MTALHHHQPGVGAYMARHRKGGRPRKTGPRHPSGQLVRTRPQPNERVLEERRQLVGDSGALHLGDHPLDVAMARKLITQRQHRAGMAFMRIHAQANLGGPRMGSGDLSASAPQAVLTTHDKRAVREWTDEEVSAVFDQIFNRTPRMAGDERMQNAQSQLNLLCGVMTAVERMAVLSVCTRAEWPAWLEHRVGRRTLKATNDPEKILAQARTIAAWDRQREHLVKGLDRIAGALFVKVRAEGGGATEQRSFGEMNATPSTVSTPSARRTIEETTDYVNGDGELLWTVIRKRRLTR